MSTSSHGYYTHTTYKLLHTNMNIRTTLLTLVAVLGASSCGDRNILRESTILHFRPRVCTQMFTLPQEDVDIVEEAGGKVYRRQEYV